MVSLVSAAALLVVIGAHTLLSAVATRFFRIHLDTQWGVALYVLVAIPAVLLVSTLFFGGALGLGPDLGSRELAITALIVLPVALGYAIDVFWMPHPDEVDVPDTARR